MLNTEKTQLALAIAMRAHRGQRDKAGEDYIKHPLYIAEQMDDEDSTVVALLHDVVEDSDITFDELCAHGFSVRVIDALKLLTHDDGEDYFSYIARVRENPLAAKVKLADLRHNSDWTRLPDISENDRTRLEKYRRSIGMLSCAEG